MGLLVVGTPLDWDDSKSSIDKVKRDGVTQFLALYDRLKGREGEPLYWGDEVRLLCFFSSPARTIPRAGRRLADQAPSADIPATCLQIEYLIVAFDNEKKRAYLSLSQGEILTKLAGVVHDLQCDESKE